MTVQENRSMSLKVLDSDDQNYECITHLWKALVLSPKFQNRTSEDINKIFEKNNKNLSLFIHRKKENDLYFSVDFDTISFKVSIVNFTMCDMYVKNPNRHTWVRVNFEESKYKHIYLLIDTIAHNLENGFYILTNVVE